METLIRIADLHYTYGTETPNPVVALQGVDCEVFVGEYLAIVGRNGSGKSTLSKCLNGLLQPTEGDVWVGGLNTRERAHLLEIRSSIGMVFQNPENQFLTTSVQEEVAFGPENLGLERAELRRRVDLALEQVGLDVPHDRDPRYLSAGEKAKLAIATVLAMAPRCLVLDESTAMLDPMAREQVMSAVRSLQREGMTLLTVTHYMDEAALADRVLVLQQGAVAALDTPYRVFGDPDLCAAAGLDAPMPVRIANGLRARGLDLPQEIITPDELADALLGCRERER